MISKNNFRERWSEKRNVKERRIEFLLVGIKRRKKSRRRSVLMYIDVHGCIIRPVLNEQKEARATYVCIMPSIF